MSEPTIDILLVEDNPNDVELTLHALNRFQPNLRIEVARDGEEALELMLPSAGTGLRPRLVLLDLKLPKVDGLEVLRQIKQDPATHPAPVVMLTSSREQRDLVESYRLGANSYVVKPVDWDELSTAVRSIGSYWLEINEQLPA